MEPTSLPDAPATRALSAAERALLLRIAGDSIAHGLAQRAPLPVQPDDYAPALRVPTATFCTLHLGAELRGCIGTLEAVRPLVADVAHNAYGAAFRDPRFPPVGVDEYVQLTIHLSLLSAAEEMAFASEEDLLTKLRPGVDGLVLTEDRRRGTFLPAVWETLPDPRQFLAHLKLKAGLPTDYWSPTLRVERYTTEAIP